MLSVRQVEVERVRESSVVVMIMSCRLVKDIEDPSLVPEYWVCSMNTVSRAIRLNPSQPVSMQDPGADECGKGEGEAVESDEELVGVEYGCGSLVWIKFPGTVYCILVQCTLHFIHQSCLRRMFD